MVIFMGSPYVEMWLPRYACKKMQCCYDTLLKIRKHHFELYTVTYFTLLYFTLVGVVSSDVSRSSCTTSFTPCCSIFSQSYVFFQGCPCPLLDVIDVLHPGAPPSSFKVHPSAPYVMTGHMSAFTNFILSSFRIPLSFQIVSSSMVAFLALPILSLMSSEQLPVLVLMVPRYLKEFTLAIVSPSMSIDTFALSSPTTISLVFRAFNFSSLRLTYYIW